MAQSDACRTLAPRAQRRAQFADNAVAQRSAELAHGQAQFELAKLGENGADPAVDLGRPAGPRGIAVKNPLYALFVDDRRRCGRGGEQGDEAARIESEFKNDGLAATNRFIAARS